MLGTALQEIFWLTVDTKLPKQNSKQFPGNFCRFAAQHNNTAMLAQKLWRKRPAAGDFDKNDRAKQQKINWKTESTTSYRSTVMSK
ncbi:hypothetical protein Tcan_16693 [Toxocara canis]|uniref:Uncharacterized protein n=1 Tax=Toxocara canis TaxID=6265 RepID=A0A0B2VIA1_TOXCA|nr:hypothetical protein Tcan_16693 [Toxocara canis]